MIYEPKMKSRYCDRNVHHFLGRIFELKSYLCSCCILQNRKFIAHNVRVAAEKGEKKNTVKEMKTRIVVTIGKTQIMSKKKKTCQKLHM